MTNDNDDVTPVRTGEELDWRRLGEWLRAHLPSCGIAGLDVSRDMRAAQFPGGHSNLTYLIAFGETELVIRRPPLGPVPPTAHDMRREHRWLTAVHPIFPLAPRAYLFCGDDAVVGSMFYVMERRRGIVIRHDEPPALAGRPDARRRAGAALVDTLADLHAIDVAANGVSGLGKPAGFLERQVRGWTSRWEGSKTTDVPEMDALAAWLRDHLPPDPIAPTIVHGDFKLDNVMFDVADVGRPVAVLDWEMCALGDPLVDVGILLAYWRQAPAGVGHDAVTSVTHRPGWAAPSEIVERYAERSGRDVSGMRFYEAFANFKIAVVIQQIFFRYTRGQTSDPRFASFDRRVARMAREAASLVAR